MDKFKPLDLFGDGIETKSETENPVIPTDSSAVPLNEDNCDKECTSESEKPEKDVNGDEIPIGEPNFSITNEENDGNDCNNATIDALYGIEKLCEQLSSQMSSMEQLFSKRIMHAEYEDKIIDQMHAELQKYKEDMYAQLVRPILLDIIEVRDSILRISATYMKKPEGEQNIPNKTFADYSYDLQDILEKNNVEIYRSNPGDDFTPIKQRVVKKEVTHDESLHGKIAESLSSGYSYTGRVISAEKVSVYYYENVEETKNESEETNNG